MDETDVLVPNNFDLVNQTEPAKIIPQLLFGGVLVQTAEIYISARIALLNRQSDLAGNRGRLSPANLQFLSMQGQFFYYSVGVELSGSGGIQEGQKDARLFREHSDRFKGTKVD